MRAYDTDVMDTLIYSMLRPTSDTLFTIIPNSGNVYITDAGKLRKNRYNLDVYALDLAGHKSAPVRLTVHVIDDVTPREVVSEMHDTHMQVNTVEVAPKRSRRQAVSDLEERIFVVSANDEAPIALFSVASYEPVIPEEQYMFMEPAPVGLSLDEETGLVSREADHVWASSQLMFDVIVTLSDDAAC